MRSPVLFIVVAPGAQTGEPRSCKRSAALAEPGADLGSVRTTDVLSPLRARVLRAEQKAIPERRKARRYRAGRREGRDDRHLPRAPHTTLGRRRDARDLAR